MAQSPTFSPVTPTRGPSRFHLVIKPRSGPPRPYAWEIYEDGQDELFRQSGERFRSFAEAWKAGSVALEEIRARG